MKALMKISKGENSIQIKDINEPLTGENEIKIKINYGGICGTDIHIMKDEYEANYPVVMGHEYSGIICEVGRNVQNFKVGDKVVSLTAVVTCGCCKYCYEGLLMLCDERKSIGSGVNGAFAEYMVVPAHLAFKIPDGVSMDEAALCEPLACVVRAVMEENRVNAGEYVLVIGPGTIGLLTLQVAMANGGKVVVTGTKNDEERLKEAEKMGAYGTIMVDKEDVYKKTSELTDGCGFDVVFECAGVAASADMCLDLVRKKGRYGQVGLFGKSILFDHDKLLKKELDFSVSYASERTSWETALRLLKFKQVNLKPLISDKLPLEEWQKAFKKVINKEGYKILMVPNNG